MEAGPMKAQGVRLLDVFVVGPFMLWAAVEGRELGPRARGFLGLLGLLTISYNGVNYLEVKRMQETDVLTDAWRLR